MKIQIVLSLSALLPLGLLIPAHAQSNVVPPNPFSNFERSRSERSGVAKSKPNPTLPNQPPKTMTEKEAALWLSKPTNFGIGKKAGEIKVNPIDGAQMVWIPAGSFLMGSAPIDKYAKTSEKPQHKVNLSGYWMYRTEVTVGQYKKFVAATNGKMPPEPSAKWKDNNPITNVTWADAKAYCAWVGGRLPTEAQWEKAARGTNGRLFPNGNTFTQNYGWSKEASGGFDAHVGTAPVGSFPKGASPYGCLDMAGNVWEWCEDFYGEKYYEVSPTNNPKGPSFSGLRVFRGGGWLDVFRDVRCANRGSNVPTLFNDTLGFRCMANPLAADNYPINTATYDRSSNTSEHNTTTSNLTFDGIDDYLSLKHVSGLESNNPVHTIEAWVRVDNPVGTKPWLLLLGSEGDGAHYWLVKDNGTFRIGVWGGGERDFTVPVGKWNHLASAFDGKTLKIYVNGVLTETTPARFNLRGIPLTVGRGYLTHSFLKGAVRQVSIWKVARKPEEILSDMNASLTGKEAGLISFWPLSEGSGSVATDTTGNKNNGQLVNAPQWLFPSSVNITLPTSKTQ